MKHSFFENIKYLETVDSTNTYLKQNDFSDKTIVYSFNQTNGRGRFNREWINFENKNLAISFSIKLHPSINNHTWYIACSSLALVEILEALNIKNCWIKWPNDIFIGDKKISGILAESTRRGQPPLSGTVKNDEEHNFNKLIIGIGININCSEKDLRIIDRSTTSVLIQTRKIHNLNVFFNRYLERLSYWLRMLIDKKNVSKIKKKWLEKSKIRNKYVEWAGRDFKIKGRVIDIDADGYLIINNGEEKVKIYSGDVNLIYTHN